MEGLETAVVDRARKGDADAFRELVERYSARLFRLAYRITGEEAAAEDAVQESFLRAYRWLSRFDARAQFGTWLYRIAVNTTIEMMRKQKRHHHPQPVLESGEPDPLAALPSAGPGPERLALSQEVERAVRAAMGELTPLERAAFVLRHFEGRSIAEICAHLGLGESAGKHAVFRAVRKLRGALAPLAGKTAVEGA
ncbi:MAG TPA: sigma-70 family RNA polymerase sigma factor [Thermoanaerobaculia bacterium]|nr:sigma-70 family RNA polymerase sigma factor [Thermoanaerobaculia bacterium]